VQSQVAAATLVASQLTQFNTSETIGGTGVASAPTNRAEEELKTALHNFEIVLHSEGTGTVAQRVAEYLEVYGGAMISSVQTTADATSGVSDVPVTGVSVQEASENLGIVAEAEAKETMQKAIRERVTARLNERLQSMTMEERANARGLLRLQEDGKLDEYFASLFSEENGTLNVEPDENAQYSIYYLLDSEAVGGAGHAAMIMGSETEGWYYFSFGSSDTTLTANGNLDVDFFPTLIDAQKNLDRYGYFLRWDVKDSSSIRSAFKEATSHMNDKYNVFWRNCDDIASDIIRAAGVKLDDRWVPNYTYLQEEESDVKTGSWKEIR
jgi:hypothetical protein